MTRVARASPSTSSETISSGLPALSTASSTGTLSAMAFGGMTLADLDAAARQERGLAADSLALLVKGMGQFNNKHGAAKKAGFLKDDVIVAIDDVKTRATEAEMIGQLLQTRMINEVVDVTVLRGAERVALKLPMQ